MMNTKKPLQSRTILLNTIFALLGAIVLVFMDYLPQLEAYLSPRTFLILQIILGVANVFIRMITHQAIGVNPPPVRTTRTRKTTK